MLPEAIRCYLVRKTAAATIEASVETRPFRDLPPGDTVIRVEASSLNYKDAMAAIGHSGIVKSFPHVPGIDAAGTIVHSESPRWKAGRPVIMTGYQQGAERWGAWAEYVRVPAEWVVPLPESLSLREAMILGTAGFTAAQCVWSLQHHSVTPESGPVVVTGATGGVGTLSLMLLSRLGYSVTAVSGKQDKYAWLRSLGASDVVGRDAVHDGSDRALLRPRWAGAVDTVGGTTLATLIRSLQHRGCVAACGLVGGHELPLTVYPFILRGVTLDGIDSAMCPYGRRLEIWSKLAGDWKLDNLEQLATDVDLESVGEKVQQMLAGRISGRVVVSPLQEGHRSHSTFQQS
jgi:acrylyl-CoA reductase (NADPH)